MDKNKIIEAAAKLVAKGAYDKAIKEYQRILDADPKDVRILQKMGELYQNKNDEVQAAHGIGVAFGAGDGNTTTPETDGGHLISLVKAYAASPRGACP